jgi:hypothetical protein
MHTLYQCQFPGFDTIWELRYKHWGKLGDGNIKPLYATFETSYESNHSKIKVYRKQTNKKQSP